MKEVRKILNLRIQMNQTKKKLVKYLIVIPKKVKSRNHRRAPTTKCYKRRKEY